MPKKPDNFNRKFEYDGHFEYEGKTYYYRGKDDTNSSKIITVNHQEHIYRMVEVYDSETGEVFAFSMACGESFMLFPEDVKNSFVGRRKSNK